MTPTPRPWAALWTLIIGFFMILLDSTIVSVATPQIMADLHTDTTGAVWVTSAYLLAYVVPLLLAGRLGDRFGQRRIYLAGLAVFTAASLACGLATTLGLLVAARVVQGLGAALITPQTMAVVTRIFPAERRGPAMAVWGTVGGVAAVVGPLVGGVLVSAHGWQWIFYVNVPVGVLGFVLALALVPVLPTASRGFDLAGVALSGIGLFGVVYGVQQGGWAITVAGVAVLVAFVAHQARQRSAALLPLRIFTDRDFSLAGVGMAAMGFAITCIGLPLMLYAQNVLHYTPLRSALLLLPMAVTMVLLARVVGGLIAKVEPRYLAGAGFAAELGALIWLGTILTPDLNGWDLVGPSALLGVGSAFIAAPLSTTAFRRLPPALAGAGSGAFTTIRQVGAVLGSAAIAAVMRLALDAQFPRGTAGLPVAQIADGYATAMGHSLYLPAAVLVLGLVSSLFFTKAGAATVDVVEREHSPAGKVLS